MKKNNWLPYILLNILVSATTTLLVLVWWDRTHTPLIPTPNTMAMISTPLPAPTATLPPLDAQVITIKTVFGVGNLDTEAVVLNRLGEGRLELSGWSLQDQDKHVYTFPILILNKEGAIQINSRAGNDTVIELFWGQKRAIWQAGEIVSLFDSAGNLRASYQIP